MVLKRLLVTTLGALGLGALAAGTASGQSAGEGNIPAPDIFDDQITCSMVVPPMSPTPTVIPMGGMTSPLDDAIAMGTVAVTDSDTLGLGYVIPPAGMNCGGGPTGPMFGAMDNDANDDGDLLDTGDTIGAGSIPVDVANGYSELLPLFEAVYGNPGQTTGGTARALQAANKALADAIEAGQSGTALTPLQNAITRAQEAHNMALARFNSAAGGPVYQAGVAEWMAKAAVTKSIVDYNAQVVKTNDALTDLDGLDYGSYVPLGTNELITTVVTFDAAGMATIVATQLEQYINAVLGMSEVAEVSMNGVTTTTDSNFDLAGNLIVPMQYYEPDGTASSDQENPSDDAVLRAIVVADGDANQIGNQNTPGQGIRDVVERTNAAAAALKKLRDDNVVTSVQSIYNDAYARAQAEADYYNGVWAQVLADNTDLREASQKLPFVDDNNNGINEATETTENTSYIENPITIAGRAAAYTTESNKRFTAEQGLRAAVATREAATSAVRAAFNSPQSFYHQLVARRQALKATADKAVTDATADGGTAPKSVTDAQAAAAKALTDAETARDDLLGLFADEEDPTVALLNELVKTGGDDGQALVDAISATYETAAGAADAAREVVNELTGEGGAVSTNTANIATNMSNIENNSNDIVALEEEVWDADGNSRIDANETRSMHNRTMIMTNTENIATNATNIMGLRTDVDQNTADIETNAGNVMMNSGRIDANETAIGMNADAIASNMNSIGSNQSAISDNRNMIGELSDDLDVVRAGVAASMALAGMPAINGRGISIGVGSFDGESAFAVGFQIQGEMASFKVGVTSASGATGASAGVGFQF